MHITSLLTSGSLFAHQKYNTLTESLKHPMVLKVTSHSILQMLVASASKPTNHGNIS